MGIEHYCSLVCMNESKLFISQLSDESIYHRKPIKEKPLAPEKPQVVTQQSAKIVITENSNMNKDVDHFSALKNVVAKKNVVERNNKNTNHVSRQNYNKKNIIEKTDKIIH